MKKAASMGGSFCTAPQQSAHGRKRPRTEVGKDPPEQCRTAGNAIDSGVSHCFTNGMVQK
jgi:hypothetical protein